MENHDLVLMGIGFAAALGWMLLAWIIYRIYDNASWVDLFWGSGIGLLSVYWGVSFHASWVEWSLIAMVLLWALRISQHLLRRILSGPEDGRYANIRNNWKKGLHAKFFWFFQFQGVLVIVLSLPALLVARGSLNAWGPLQLLALLLFVVAWGIETLADHQLEWFKKDATRKGQVCRDGLWSVSRHPNYFGEVLIWVSWALFVSSVSWGFLAWIAPALIAYFILFVTGIPQTEAQSLRNRPEQYRKYQREVSVFIPWFAKKESQV